MIRRKVMSLKSLSKAGSRMPSRVIAGSYEGKQGPAFTFTPIQLWDVELKSGKAVDFKLEDGHTVALLCFNGELTLNAKKKLGRSELALFSRQGETITVAAEKDSKILLMSGEPIPEPVVGYGPFVMNSHAEIGQAIQDYQSGKMGTLDG